ncbi:MULTISPECIES: TonB system transport protein ExbD [Vibrio]|uniref:TonB system transport protein ExbD n=1 Tax=Vibrio TaxID=662 RepID=UPI0005AEE613|nr:MULTISPECIES: TonB system transport protein ExbD [Vibrio]KIP76466.1 biopolymer transporter [Vibrio harveyi]
MGFKPASDSDDMVENHEINVTPLVDVMLVLLIIVMVAAPLATVNVAVDLPTSSAEPLPQPDKPVYLTIQKDLTLVVGEKHETSLADLEQTLIQAEVETGTRIFLRADKSLSYQDLMKVMNAMVASGYNQIALVGVEQVSGATQ